MFNALKPVLFSLALFIGTPLMASDISDPSGSNIEVGEITLERALSTAKKALKRGEEIMRKAKRVTGDFQKKKATDVRAGLWQAKFMIALKKNKRVANAIFKDLKAYNDSERSKIDKTAKLKKAPKVLMEMSGNYLRYLQEYFGILEGYVEWSLKGKTSKAPDKQMRAVQKRYSK